MFQKDKVLSINNVKISSSIRNKCLSNVVTLKLAKLPNFDTY